MKEIKIGNRIMDVAFLRHNETEYTGEALVLAVLFKTKGAGRGSDDHKYLKKMLDDPNEQ
jgi:hypothetical protein